MPNAPLIDTTQIRLVPNAVIRAYRKNNPSFSLPFFEKEATGISIGYELSTDSEGRLYKGGNGAGSSSVITSVCLHEPAVVICRDIETGTVIKQFDANLTSSTEIINDSVDHTVNTYQDMIHHLTADVGDIVRVLNDEEQSYAESYYRITDNDTVNTAELIGTVDKIGIKFISLTDRLPQDVTGDAEHYAIKYTGVVDGVPKSYTMYYSRRDVTGNKLIYGCMADDKYAYIEGDLATNTWGPLHEGAAGSGGGLLSVVHDNTLSGDGTSANPLSVVGGGSSSHSTLFETVADMQAASLNVGDVVETAGFYSVGDGGGAKYQIQSTGTANGMDLIAVAGRKIAKVLLKQSGFPEQIGYQLRAKNTAMDLSVYIDRLSSIGCRKIMLHGTGGQPYYMLTPFSTNKPDIHIIGALSLSSGFATRIYFVPNETSTAEQAMFTFSTRCNSIEHCILRCDTTNTDLNTIGVKYSCPTLTDSFGNQLHDCAIQQFGIGISFAKGGASGDASAFNWHMSFTHLLMNNYKMNLYLNGQFYCVKFYNCLFNASNFAQYNVLTECSSFTAEFECCNFGMLMPQDTLFKINPWIVESAPVNERTNTFTFNSCQFEFEEANGLPSNVRGLLFNVENWMENELMFNGCVFIITPLARHDIYSCTAIKLGSNTRARFVGCKGPQDDVDYTGNYFLEKDYDKLMIDRNSPPRKEVGSVIIEHSFGLGFTDFGSEYLPCTIVDNQLPLVDNNTNFVQKFKLAKDGQQLFNIDTGRVVVKVGNNLVNVSEAPQNIVRIGNEIYNYVVINGLKWITRNLNLRTYQRNYQYWNHPEWGQYYKNSDFNTISEILPNGWRIPTSSDILSLVGDGSAARARSMQKLGYSVWANATNSTGFSADPSLRWYRPNQVSSQNFNRAILWGDKTSAGTDAIIIAENSISKGGWDTTTAAGLMIPLRVCADA